MTIYVCIEAVEIEKEKKLFLTHISKTSNLKVISLTEREKNVYTESERMVKHNIILQAMMMVMSSEYGIRARP